MGMNDLPPLDRPFFIVNPASGGGRTRHRVGALIDAIERMGMEADCAFTTRPGEGIAIAREAVEKGRTYLVACGGDGTVNEVVNGVMAEGAAERVKVGTVPMGTGKDIAKCLGVGRGAEALRAMARGEERRVDAGKVTAVGEDGREQVRYFLLEASAGWVPEISQSTPRWLKRLGDTAPYVVMTVVKMVGPMSRGFTLRIDGQEFDGRYNTVSVHNMELWGGDLVAAPGAAPDDGLFDVVRWGDLGRRAVMRAVEGQRRGGMHLEMEGIERHPARVVELSSPKVTRLDLDGEMGGFLPARIEVTAGAVRFVAPTDGSSGER